MERSHRLRTIILATTVLAGSATNTGLAAGRLAGSPAVQLQLSPLRPAGPGMTGIEIFTKLLQHNHLRDAQLERYSAVRTYQVTNGQGKLYATEIVRVRYLAPDHEHFSITSAEGSWLVRDLVLKRLIKSEAKTSSGLQHRDTSLKPANYSFQVVGQQDVGPYHCYVVQALPRREDKRLFEGRIWIDSRDYGVVRIDGQPAGKLSFWIESAHFVRQYQRMGQFWLPWRDESTVHVRLAGTKILTIVHRQYTVNGRLAASVRPAGLFNPYRKPAGPVEFSRLSEFIPPLTGAIDSQAPAQAGANDLH
jgi:hypothetical protein